jgi:hypothetical protein
MLLLNELKERLHYKRANPAHLPERSPGVGGQGVQLESEGFLKFIQCRSVP